MAVDLGTKVCRYCGRVFERKFGRQLYCSERCREANENEHRRVCRKAERDAMLDAEVSEKLSLMSAGPVNKAGNAELCGTDFGKRFVSIKEAALLFGVSRPTIYKRITTGEIHPVKVASKTVRISVSELLTGSGLETRPNKGDFSVPVRLDEALKIYRVSRGKFFEEVRKAGIRPKKYKGVDFFPKNDLDRLFPILPDFDRNEWYSVEELVAKSGMCAKSVRDYARKNNIRRMKDGVNVLIFCRDWDRMRFSNGREEEFMTVDQAKKFYRIGQVRFYDEVNAAGIERMREGRFVYFRKSDLDALFGADVDVIPEDIRKNYICAKDCLKIYHVGQKRFSEDTKAFGVEKKRYKLFVWYRKEDLDRVFGKPGTGGGVNV